ALRTPPAACLFPYTTLFRSLIDEAADLDVEIMDDWMFVYAKSKLDFSNPHQLSRLLGIVDTVGKKTRSRSVRYADDRVLADATRSEEHTSELQSREKLVCRL